MDRLACIFEEKKDCEDITWRKLYRDLAGGLQSLDSIIKSFTGTLVVRWAQGIAQGFAARRWGRWVANEWGTQGTWVAYLLRNDYGEEGTPLFYITAPLWFYILAVHITSKQK